MRKGLLARPAAAVASRASRHRVAVERRVAAGDVVLELALDVGEQAAGAEAEEGRLHPVATELLAHEDQPGERILGGGDAAGRLEADLEAGALPVVADGPN